YSIICEKFKASMNQFYTYCLVLLSCCCFACANDDTTKETNTVEIQQEKMAQQAEKAPEVERKGKPRLVFFGNSLSAGYGLSDPSQGFVGLLAQRILGARLSYQIENAGLSGETTAGGLSRIDWYLKRPIDVIVIELGGNDGLRGIDPYATKQNLQGMIDKIRTKSPDTKIVLAGMEAPPNMGEEFTTRFRNLYKELAQENDVRLIPFLLEGVAGDPSLNLPDGIHPNPAGHRKVANNVWEQLQKLL
ncbi:MAG: arylesterase, partial [Bacteroidota bacterium]